MGRGGAATACATGPFASGAADRFGPGVATLRTGCGIGEGTGRGAGDGACVGIGEGATVGDGEGTWVGCGEGTGCGEIVGCGEGRGASVGRALGCGATRATSGAVLGRMRGAARGGAGEGRGVRIGRGGGFGEAFGRVTESRRGCCGGRGGCGGRGRLLGCGGCGRGFAFTAATMRSTINTVLVLAFASGCSAEGAIEIVKSVTAMIACKSS